MKERPLASGAMLLVALAVLAGLPSASAEPADTALRRARQRVAAGSVPGGSGCLTAVVATSEGSTTVCSVAGCTAGTVTESHDPGVAASLQWGYRSVAGGHIAAIPGETGSSYLIRGTDFARAGTYRLVVIARPSCGPVVISNEVLVTVEA